MNILIIGAGMYVTGRNNTGTGTILASLAQASKTLNIENVTVVAKNPQNAEVVKEATLRINQFLGTHLVTDYQLLSGNVAEDIAKICATKKYHCAIVSVPDHLHYIYSAELLKQGVHTLVVKPLTPTLEEALSLVELQEKYQVYGAVEFHKRWDETNLYIKKALKQQQLGKILYFTVDYSQKIMIPKDIFKQWSSQTNIFQYLGVHYVDLIYYLTNFKPIRLMALGTNGILKASNIDTYDSVHSTILWQNPNDEQDTFLSMLNINWIDPNCTSAMSDQKYKVIGTKGRIECDQKNRGLELVHQDIGIAHPNPYFSDYLPDQDGNLQFGGYGHKSIEQFLKDVISIQNAEIQVAELDWTRPSFKDSLVSTAIIDAVNQSLAQNGTWIDIPKISL